jgi:hypothetical protein
LYSNDNKRDTDPKGFDFKKYPNLKGNRDPKGFDLKKLPDLKGNP